MNRLFHKSGQAVVSPSAFVQSRLIGVAQGVSECQDLFEKRLCNWPAGKPAAHPYDRPVKMRKGALGQHRSMR